MEVMDDEKTGRTIPIRDAVEAGSLTQTRAKLDAVCDILRTEYGKKHRYPWIIAYSGGKDSTLLAHMVFEMLLKLSPESRRRDVHVVGNDTLVESPLVIGHLRESMKKIKKMVEKHDLPVRTVITRPDTDQTFWVNVIGRGYVPPSRIFRWCTDRMKIQPTNNYILRRASERDRTILLIGARRSESTNRRRTMAKYYADGAQMSKHPSLDKCTVFSPIADLTTDEVWTILLQSRPPWGGTYRNLITLYRNARGGGECPLVLSKDDAPSCGTTSPRFGCWTCTVVPKDRSMSGLIDSGHEEFEPLMEFRDWLQEIRDDKSRRMKTRRDGTVRYNEGGEAIYGPFTLRTREEILDRLDRVEKQMSRPIITKDERDYIAYIWKKDAILDQVRNRPYP